MRSRRTPNNMRNNYSNHQYDEHPISRNQRDYYPSYKKKSSPLLTIVISIIGGAAVAVGGMMYYDKHVAENSAQSSQAITAPLAQSQSNQQAVNLAKIIAVTPNYITVDKPVKSCKTVESQVSVPNPNKSTTTGTAIGGATGAVAGGIIGNQIKQGGGGTIVGGVLGAATGALIGHEVQKANQPEYITKTEPVKVCNTVIKSVKQVSDYQLTYNYNGHVETATTKKKYKVGTTVDYNKLQANLLH